MTTDPIKYIQYARKSSEGEERQALSIEGQLKDNQRLILDKQAIDVIGTITDEASASIPYNRPGYTEMIRRIKNGEASGIVVWHVDRLLRNPLEEGEFRWLLQTGVIRSVWTPSREYRSGDNGLLFSIEASMATQYSVDLSVKVRRGTKQKCEMGQPPRVAPIGYLNSKLVTHGTNYIMEDPERFHIIRKGFELMLSGAYTVPEVAAILNTKYELRTRVTKCYGGKAVSRSTMYRVFTDPFYYGYFYHSGILYKGAYKPMITVDEFDTIQRIMGRKGKPRAKKHRFPFTGLMTCGTCGCAVTATEKVKKIKSTGEVKSYVFYHCTRRKKGCEQCPENRYTKSQELEAMISKELENHRIDEGLYAWAMRYFHSKHADEIEKRKRLAQSVYQQEVKLVTELDNLVDLRISGAITEQVFIQKKEEREQSLIRIRAKRGKLEKDTSDWLTVISKHLDFAVNASKSFREADTDTKKEICKQFGWNWVLKGKKLFIDKREWLHPIKTMKELQDRYFGPLEPKKSLMKYDYNAMLDLFGCSLRSLRHHVRTSIETSTPNRKEKINIPKVPPSFY